MHIILILLFLVSCNKTTLPLFPKGISSVTTGLGRQRQAYPQRNVKPATKKVIMSGKKECTAKPGQIPLFQNAFRIEMQSG